MLSFSPQVWDLTIPYRGACNVSSVYYLVPPFGLCQKMPLWMLQHEVRGVKDIYLVLSSHTPSNFLLLELGESTFIRGIPRWRVIDSFVFACLLYLSNFQHLITTLRMITTKKIKVLEKGKALCHVRYRC